MSKALTKKNMPYETQKYMRVEKIDEHHYRYIADVFDTTEMIPWIRTFVSRITRMNFSNRTAENQFRADIQEMYRMYGLSGGEERDFQ